MHVLLHVFCVQERSSGIYFLNPLTSKWMHAQRMYCGTSLPIGDTWDQKQCPEYRGVLISGMRGSASYIGCKCLC